MSVLQVPNEKSFYEAKDLGESLKDHPQWGKYAALHEVYSLCKSCEVQWD